MISNAITSGLSALRLGEARVAVTADNIANANNRSALPSNSGGADHAGYAPRAVSAVSLSTGGVFPVVRAVEPAYTPVPDGTGGTEARPNVDLASEFVGLTTASRAYQSAVAVVRTADDMQRTLLDIKR